MTLCLCVSVSSVLKLGTRLSINTKTQRTQRHRKDTMRIEINGKDTFWRDAVIVEWEHQHPDRKLIEDTSGSYLIKDDWLEDLKRIANGCFSNIVVAPADPSRRSWFRQFFPSDTDRET